jgi:hypothetical protein
MKYMKDMKNKITIIIAAMLFMAFAASAQSKHEFSVQAGGGLSTLNYKSVEGNSKTGLGFNAGLGYTYFFNTNWGISTGVGVALFNGKYDIPSFSESYQSNDGTENFEYRYTAKNYNEKQNAILLNIPLMLRFQSGKFYAAFGGKVGLPLSAKYENSLSELQASGYYPQYDLTLNDPAFIGFGTFKSISNKDDLKLKTAFFASAEVGAKWNLSAKTSLYTGVYLDYGLNDILKKDAATKQLITYNTTTPDDYKPNSILESSTRGVSFADKVTPLSAGIKFSLAFGGKSK